MTANFLIRPFQPADESAVVGVWQASGLTHPNNNPYKDIARKSKVNPELFLVGELDGQIVGTVMVGYEGHRGWINYLGVTPDYQKHGYGEALMAEAEKLLRQRGCPKINLQVRTSNTKVIGFYQRLGFSIDDTVSMGKRLEPDNVSQ